MGLFWRLVCPHFDQLELGILVGVVNALNRAAAMCLRSTVQRPVDVDLLEANPCFKLSPETGEIWQSTRDQTGESLQ